MIKKIIIIISQLLGSYQYGNTYPAISKRLTKERKTKDRKAENLESANGMIIGKTRILYFII